MSAISAPRIARISGPFGASFVKSTTWLLAPPSVAGRRNWISPSTIRPGRSTIRRIDRAVTLLPQPLSPTMPRVAPGYRSKLTPSTAFTVPSSWGKYVFRFRTDKSVCVAVLTSIGIGGVPQSIAQEVEGHDDDDHGHGRDHQPRGDGHRLDVLGLLQQDAPADRGRTQAQAQEAQRGLADDHRGQGERGRRDDVAHERRHHVHKDGPHLAAPHEPGGNDEVLLTQGQEPPPNDARQLRPPEERDDDGEGEVDLKDGPAPGGGGAQPHPERNRGDRAEDLNAPRDQRIGDPAVESREPAQDDAHEKTQRHPTEPDGERDARAVHQPRPQVASLDVRAQQEDRLGRVEALVDADQMTRHRDHAEESILEALGEEPDRDLLAGVDLVDTLEGLEVAGALDGVDVGAKSPAVEPMDGLRGHQRALRLGCIGVGIGEEVRAQDDQIEAPDDDAAHHGHAVFLEPPPHETPPRGHEDALVLRGGDGARPYRNLGRGHQVSSMRMRGSTHTRRMSEISVPITVITPSRSTIVPARNMSCAMRALSRSGPTVGNPRTSDTMMLPDTM